MKYLPIIAIVLLCSCDRDCYRSCARVTTETKTINGTSATKEILKIPLVESCEEVIGLIYNHTTDSTLKKGDTTIVIKSFTRCKPRP